MASRIRSQIPDGTAFFQDHEKRRDRRLELRRANYRDTWKRKLLSLPKTQREKIVRSGKLIRTPLRRVSKALKAELLKYRKLSAKFLAQPENFWCEICTRRREAGENICRNQATEIHHYAGRIGRLLCYVPFFKASCFFCRDWPHKHKALARRLGLLAPAKSWNVYPE